MSMSCPSAILEAWRDDGLHIVSRVRSLWFHDEWPDKGDALAGTRTPGLRGNREQPVLAMTIDDGAASTALRLGLRAIRKRVEMPVQGLTS
jgi:hypothetical protein